VARSILSLVLGACFVLSRRVFWRLALRKGIKGCRDRGIKCRQLVTPSLYPLIPLSPICLTCASDARYGNDYQMHVIRHQAVAHHFQSAPGRLVFQYPEIGNAVHIPQEYILPIVTTLSDMTSRAGDDDAGDSEHNTGWRRTILRSRNR